MITETAFNFYPLITYLGIFIVIGIALFLIHNLGGLKIFSKHDKELTSKYLDKFPLVSPDFWDKSAKMRDVENNQEIHEINKRLEILEKKIEELCNG